MTSPADDYYGCSSGGVISGGRYVAPSIDGATWAPARDGQGNVLAGNWAGLPLNTWLEVDGQVLNDVIEIPHYLNGYGSDGSAHIIGAWSGGAWDYMNQRLYMSGGGHADSHCCDVGVYMLDVAKLHLSRVVDRQPQTQQQAWDANTHQLIDANNTAPTNCPLKNGVPGASHTYHALVWVPPSVMGNSQGGLFYPGPARAIINLDNNSYSTCNWFNPDNDGLDWSNCAAFIDGSKLYGPISYWNHWKFDLAQTQATDWSETSLGYFGNGVSADINIPVGSALWGWLPERREEFSFQGSSLRNRMRYGEAIDASATNWTAYGDAITLTSFDDSHLDFNSTTLVDGALMNSAGVCYDHATETIYIVPNTVGGLLYKITGLDGNTWTTEKISGTGMLTGAGHGTYGRARLATFAGKKFLVRITSTTTPVEVMRIS